MSLQKLFYPRSVALVGSMTTGKIGYELLGQMVAGGYGDVFAVNPKAQGAFGVPGYASVTEAGRDVDLAVVASPAPTVPGVLEDCGQAGVKAAVVITAGFSEVGNRSGENEIKRVASRYGIRLVGPNCAGMLNTHHHLFPTLETRPPAGGVALVAQSGAIAGVFLAWAKQYGLGVSKFVSYGNALDLNEIDFLRYLADDPETSVVALYIETVANGRQFMRAVADCVRRKPLIVIKAGRTQTGQRATLSHTGSMAGSDKVYDAALRQSGAIRVSTIEEMFDISKGFAMVPPLQGRRVAIVTNSGGPGVLAADRADEAGLNPDEPSPGLREKLSAFLPAHCALKNPVDLTVEGTEDGYRKTLLALLEEYDAALALNIAPPYLDSMALARGVCDAAALAGKPVVASFLPDEGTAAAVVYLQEHGVPNFATGERAIAALEQMAAHETRASVLPPLAEAPIEQGSLPGTGQLLEPDAMDWLRDSDIPVPRFQFAATQASAAQASNEIGYPVVMKVVSPDILHKSDSGGVVLDICDETMALAAFEKVRQAAAGKDFRGVVIYPMIQRAQEVLIGISQDPQFGPVVVLGLGGIYAEVWRDISMRVAPVGPEEAHAMIRELRSFPLLVGARGQAPCDLSALADLIVTVSRLPFRCGDIAEMDLNPVFLFSKGLVIGDVRVVRMGSTQADHGPQPFAPASGDASIALAHADHAAG